MGIRELVISWNAEDLLRSARKHGYHVYAEVPVAEAPAMARATVKNDLAGIIVNPADSQQNQIGEAVRELRSAYPRLPVLVVNPNAKQPQMKGQLVIKRDGVLQVSSPTAQPWLDSNLALIRIDQALRPGQIPLYSFQWDQSDPLQREQGPDTADYLLAVAEAGAFHADLILNLHPKQQTDLLQNNTAAWAAFNQIKRYLAFSYRTGFVKPEANIAVVTDSHQNSYEPINLLARHNLPFAVLEPSDLKPHGLNTFCVLLVFTPPDERTTAAIIDFASRGGVALLVDSHGSHPWQSAHPVRTSEHSISYALGKGRILELSEPVIDPEIFAADLGRLIEKDKVWISLWNALTTVAVPYRGPGSQKKVVELVNYAQEPLQVQVRVKGSFSSVLYETPERGCCESLTPIQRKGFTEFVVPALRIAGRVHLAVGNDPHKQGR